MSGADGLGEIGGGGSSRSNMDDAEAFRASVAALVAANGTATQVSASARASITARIYTMFAARSQNEKESVDMGLVYYFGAHGTSPDTEWTAYGIDYPMIINSKQVAPQSVVAVIGQANLKKFMGHYTPLAIRMVKASPEFAAAVRERASRAGLAAGQEYLAIDFVGKDGSLSVVETTARVEVRNKLLHHRAMNAVNISSERAKAAGSISQDVRALTPGSRGPAMHSFDS